MNRLQPRFNAGLFFICNLKRIRVRIFQQELSVV
nr:MAG TPA: hypothetical protein [Caudoviricetes sp.]DAZ17284.1 MAG TPA: hypothetical protein [Caudoviricetes sp.]